MTLPIAGISGISGMSGVGALSAPNGVSASALTQLQSGASLDSLGGLAGTDALGGVGASSGAVSAAGATREASFANVLGQSLGSLERLDQTAQVKGVEAATGDLTDVHDYVIAATEAQTATELTTTMRNKALEAFNEIMRMPL